MHHAAMYRGGIVATCKCIRFVLLYLCIFFCWFNHLTSGRIISTSPQIYNANQKTGLAFLCTDTATVRSINLSPGIVAWPRAPCLPLRVCPFPFIARSVFVFPPAAVNVYRDNSTPPPPRNNPLIPSEKKKIKIHSSSSYRSRAKDTPRRTLRDNDTVAILMY